MARAECGPYEDETQTTYRQLDWADFHGPRPDDLTASRIMPTEIFYFSKIAYVSTSIRVEWSGVTIQPEGQEWAAKLVGVCVPAFMHKDRSGFKQGAGTVPNLAHEQLHFDITHYFAESLGSRLERLEVRAASRSKASRGLRERIEAEHVDTVARWRKMQARYDRETTTRFTSFWAQRRWIEKIDALLATARREPDPMVGEVHGQAIADRNP